MVLVGASLGAIAVLRHGVDDPDLAGVVTVSSPAQWRLSSPRTALAAVLTRTRVGRRLARRLGARLDRHLALARAARRPRRPADRPAGGRARPGDRFMPTTEAQMLHGPGPTPAGSRHHRRLDLVPDMGHAFCTRGLDAITDAVAWCLAQVAWPRPPDPSPSPDRSALPGSGLAHLDVVLRQVGLHPAPAHQPA